jgi:hypothetical protein
VIYKHTFHRANQQPDFPGGDRSGGHAGNVVQHVAGNRVESSTGARFPCRIARAITIRLSTFRLSIFN